MPDDDGGPVHGRRESLIHALLYQALGFELRRLVVVVERLPHVEVRFGKHAVVAAAHVAGAHVLELLDITSGGEIEDVLSPVDVDCFADRSTHAQVVHSSEMEYLPDSGVKCAFVLGGESEPLLGDVPFVEADVRPPVIAGNLGRADLGGRPVFRLDETVDRLSSSHEPLNWDAPRKPGNPVTNTSGVVTAATPEVA